MKRSSFVAPLEYFKNEIKNIEITLNIDNREKRSLYENKDRSYFFDKLKSFGIQVRKANLPLGDFM